MQNKGHDFIIKRELLFHRLFKLLSKTTLDDLKLVKNRKVDDKFHQIQEGQIVVVHSLAQTGKSTFIKYAISRLGENIVHFDKRDLCSKNAIVPRDDDIVVYDDYDAIRNYEKKIDIIGYHQNKNNWVIIVTKKIYPELEAYPKLEIPIFTHEELILSLKPNAEISEFLKGVCKRLNYYPPHVSFFIASLIPEYPNQTIDSIKHANIPKYSLLLESLVSKSPSRYYFLKYGYSTKHRNAIGGYNYDTDDNIYSPDAKYNATKYFVEKGIIRKIGHNKYEFIDPLFEEYLYDV
jgi:hypothetical protein